MCVPVWSSTRGRVRRIRRTFRTEEPLAFIRIVRVTVTSESFSTKFAKVTPQLRQEQKSGGGREARDWREHSDPATPPIGECKIVSIDGAKLHADGSFFLTKHVQPMPHSTLMRNTFSCRCLFFLYYTRMHARTRSSNCHDAYALPPRVSASDKCSPYSCSSLKILLNTTHPFSHLCSVA